MGDAIKVAIKVRPLIKREIEAGMKKEWKVEKNKITECNNSSGEATFDHVFDEDISTEEIFNTTVKPIVTDCLRGFNGTVMAYGQTSSGKTHVMMGTLQIPGIIPMVVKEIYGEIEQQQENREFLIRVSYLEIYNEKVNDLLKVDGTDLKIMEQSNGDVFVSCSECIAPTSNIVFDQIQIGNKNRCVGETNMNEKSSRSHTIFRIIIESREDGETDNDSAVHIGTLNLVDLAGSERSTQTGSSGSRFIEGTFINKSLLTLSKVINQLTEQAEPKHVNYRDSKLTRVLQNSLGGNAKSLIICTVTAAVVEETRNTLGFATRAKTIKNKPKINEVLTEQAMIKRLEKQIADLQHKLMQCQNGEGTELDIKKNIAMRRDLFIRSVQSHISKNPGKNRRRTWASDTQSHIQSSIPVAVENNGYMVVPPATFFCSTSSADTSKAENASSYFSDELFVPAEMVNFGTSNSSFDVPLIHTPLCMKRRLSLIQENDESPQPSAQTLQEKYLALERELLELQEFTKLENVLHAHDNKATCDKEIQRLKEENSCATQKSIELSQRLSEAEELLKSLQGCLELSKSNEIAAVKEKEEANKKRQEAEDNLNSKLYEFEVREFKAKNREEELLMRLKEINANVVSPNEKLGTSVDSDDLVCDFTLTDASIESQPSKRFKDVKQEPSVLNDRTDIEDIEDLKRQLNHLEIAKNNLQKEYDEMSAQIVDAVEENDDLKRKLDLTNEKLRHLESETQQYVENKLLWETENAHTKQQLSNMEQALIGLETYKVNEEKYSIRLSEAETKISQVLEENSKLLAQVKEMKEKIISCTNDNSTDRNKPEQKDLMSQSVQTDADVIKEKVVEHVDNLMLRNVPEALEEEIQELRAKLNTLIVFEETLQKKLQNVNEKLEQEERKNDKLSKLYEEIQQKLVSEAEAYSKNLSSINVQVIDMQNIQDTLKKQVKDMHNTIINTFEATKEEMLEALKKVYREKRRVSQDAFDQISLLSKELEDLRNEKLVMENELESAQSKLLFQEEHTISDLKRKLQDCAEQCDTLKMKLTETEQMHDTSETKLKNLQEEFETKINTFIEMDMRIVEVEKMLETEQLKNINLTQSLEDNLTTVEKLQEKIKSLEIELCNRAELLKQTNEELKTTNDQFNHAEEIQKLEREKLLNKLKTLEHDIASMDEGLQSKTAHIQSLKARIDELEQQQNFIQSAHSDIETKNVKLRLELDEIKRSKTDDRRRSRHSLHDYVRFGPGPVAIAVQTDPTNEKCQCGELNDKIQQLKKELMFNKLKLENHDLETKYRLDQEKMKTDEYRKRSETVASELAKVQQQLYELKAAVVKNDVVFNDKYQIKMKELSDDHEMLKRKYEDVKKICRSRNDKIKILEQQLACKENEVQNDQCTAVKAETVLSKRNVLDLESIYSEQAQKTTATKIDYGTQTICDVVSVEQLQYQQNAVKLKDVELETLTTKHNRLKQLYFARKESHLKMEAKYAEIQQENQELEKLLEQYRN